MFGIGAGELALILVVAIVVFGPDKLPEYARQAGRLVRQLRTLAQSAQNELRSELGPEYADLKLSDLDPRQAIRRHILEAMEEDDVAEAQARMKPVEPNFMPLDEGELPPFDLDGT